MVFNPTYEAIALTYSLGHPIPDNNIALFAVSVSISSETVLLSLLGALTTFSLAQERKHVCS